MTKNEKQKISTASELFKKIEEAVDEAALAYVGFISKSDDDESILFTVGDSVQIISMSIIEDVQFIQEAIIGSGIYIQVKLIIKEPQTEEGRAFANLISLGGRALTKHSEPGTHFKSELALFASPRCNLVWSMSEGKFVCQ